MIGHPKNTVGIQLSAIQALQCNFFQECRGQLQNEPKRRAGFFELVICISVCILLLSTIDGAKAGAGSGAATGAAVGGFVGLIFGDDIDDVVDSTLVGAGAGAVGGAVSESNSKKEVEQLVQKQQIAEEQRQIREELTRLQQQERSTAQSAKNSLGNEQKLIRVLGEDNYRGLLSLINCEQPSIASIL